MKGRTIKDRQQGAASIEFAFMFVLVFMVFYGMVGYVIPLVLLSSYNEISAEAVRASVLIPTNSESHEEQVRQTVNAVIRESWLGSRTNNWKDYCGPEKGGYDGTHVLVSPEAISVCIAHNNPKQIIPPITLFGWTFPKLPDALIGEAKIQLR